MIIVCCFCQFRPKLQCVDRFLVKISRFVFHSSGPGGTRTVPYGQTEEHVEAVILYSLSERPRSVVPQVFTAFAL
jgi:hypothetical protein